MAYIEEVELACLCLVTKEDKILVQNRLKNDWKGIVLPGGHIEKEEAFTDAIIREIKEETNLDIKNPKLVGLKQVQTKDHHRFITFLYKANEFTGTLKSSEEGEVMWVKRDELESLDLVEDFMELLDVFENPNKQEFLYENKSMRIL